MGPTACVPVNIGLCSDPGYASSADEILKCLDLAVSKAAETGMNQYAIYDSKLHAAHLRKQAIAKVYQHGAGEP